jgi:hypothetical protein
MGDGRTGVTIPLPGQLGRYGDEPRSSGDADDQIVHEHGYGDAKQDGLRYCRVPAVERCRRP